MKNSIALAIALVAIAIFAAPEANAQTFNQGFLFGSGINAAGGIRSGGLRPPYFAEFPPVYYNGIVRRPYGISPYAAPAGVEPVELRYQNETVKPVVVNNPHFNKVNSRPISIMDDEKDLQTQADLKNKSVRIANPFFDNSPDSLGSVMQASFER